MWAREGDFHGVETPRTINNTHKGAHTKTTNPRIYQETGRHRSG